MSRGASPVGYGLYFVDVLACLLFCITLVLVGARFSSETTVPVDLPELAGAGAGPGDTEAVSVTLREQDGRTVFHLDDEARPLSFAELDSRLRASPPPALRIRADETALARVIGLAHESGIDQIELAYETRARVEEGGRR